MSGPPNAMMEPVGDLASLRFRRGSHRWRRRSRSGGGSYAPRKPTPPPVPEALKAEVQAKADELIETQLKPRFIEPPPEDRRWNYIIDIRARWHRSFFHFGSTYASPGPNALSPTFESPFARMEYVGDGQVPPRVHAAHRQVVGGLPGADRR